MTREQMREKCEKLAVTLHWSSCGPLTKKDYADKLESFARSIRNEALDDAAKVVETMGCTPTKCASVQTIRALKDSV